MKNWKDLNNKIVLEGTVINSVRQKFDKDTKEQVVYFVLGVKREDYTLRFNKEEFNYFYCYISETLMGGTFLDKFRKEVKMYDTIRIKGVLDNFQSKQTKAKEVNYRALYAYTSTISVVDYKKVERTTQERNKEIPIINSVRKQFGKDVEVKFTENATKIDSFGLDNYDLPDY